MLLLRRLVSLLWLSLASLLALLCPVPLSQLHPGCICRHAILLPTGLRLLGRLLCLLRLRLEVVPRQLPAGMPCLLLLTAHLPQAGAPRCCMGSGPAPCCRCHLGHSCSGCVRCRWVVVVAAGGSWVVLPLA